MKKYSILIGTLIGVLSIFSCTQDKELVTLKSDNISAAAIVAPVEGTEIVLDRDHAGDEAVVFSWDAAEYGIQLSVAYELQVAAAGTDFATPSVLTNTNETSISFTNADFNSKLLEAGFMPEEANSLETRVISSVSDNVDKVISSNLSLVVTPYATDFPPIFMIGSATGGWDPSIAVEVLSTGEPFVYSTVAYFVGGEAFRFFKNAAWGENMGVDQWNTPWFETVSDLLEDANDGDNNFKVLAESGYYEITVNLKTKDIQMVAVPRPMMFLTGSAIVQTGWGWDNPTELTFLKKDVFVGEVEFVDIVKDGDGNDEQAAFRIFLQQDWGPENRGYDTVTGYDTNFITIAEGHGDPNWFFVAEPGVYKVKISLADNTFEITPKE